MTALFELDDHKWVRVRSSRGKGRGVFAANPLAKGLVCFTDPVLVFPVRDARLRGVIHRYTFEWDDDSSALCLGPGSIVNHSYTPNMRYRMLRSEKAIEFIAIEEIVTGEELTINYNFDPECQDPVGFKVK